MSAVGNVFRAAVVIVILVVAALLYNILNGWLLPVVMRGIEDAAAGSPIWFDWYLRFAPYIALALNAAPIALFVGLIVYLVLNFVRREEDEYEV